MTDTEFVPDERITYPRNGVYAPCYGTNHHHDRKIGTCPVCHLDVVKHHGQIRVVSGLGGRGRRTFCCWGEPHRHVDEAGRAALLAAFEAAKVARDEKIAEIHAWLAEHKGEPSTDEFVEMTIGIGDLNSALTRAHARCRDEGLAVELPR